MDVCHQILATWLISYILFFLLWSLKKLIDRLIWLFWILVVAHRIFHCGMWDRVPWLRDKTWAPALGAGGLNHWTTRDHQFTVKPCFTVNFKSLSFQFWLFGYFPSLEIARRGENTVPPHLVNSYLFPRFHSIGFSWISHVPHIRLLCFNVCSHINLTFFILPFIKACHCVFLYLFLLSITRKLIFIVLPFLNWDITGI